MNRQRIQAVFFDAGGTLFETRGSVGEIYGRAALSYGMATDPQAIQHRFIREFRQQPPLAFPRGTPQPQLHRLEREWWRALVQRVFADESSRPGFEQFFADLYEFFRSREAWRLFAETVPVLEALTARGLRLGIISNFDSRLDDVLRVLEIDRYFAAVHLSSRTGAAKPDPLIFQAAVEAFAVAPSQALHTGDSWRDDVQGALSAGLQAVWFDPADSGAPPHGTRRIVRLDQLPELI